MMDSKIEPYKGIARIYDEIRPSYPDKLIQDVIAKTNIKNSDRLLEIGPGTGKATLQFAERGFSVHGVELGEDMAQILKEKCASYKGVSVDVCPFEQWNSLSNDRYDMIYCAQAFHWLDREVKYKKCNALLKDDGYLVLFWYNPHDILLETEEIEEKVNKIVSSYSLCYTMKERKPERLKHDGMYLDEERKAEIEASGLFKLVNKIDYIQETENNISQYLKIKESVPAFSSILDNLNEESVEKMKKEIEEVINEYGGSVRTRFKFSLFITKKIV